MIVAPLVDQTTYLERSAQSGGPHRFYEVTRRDVQVDIRFGYIGYPGRTLSMLYTDANKADKAARRRVRRKIRAGYVQAILGQTSRMPVGQGRRATRTAPNHSTRPHPVPLAPITWKFASGHGAFGIFVNEQHCWIGNEAGHIFELDHDGQVQAQFCLPGGVKCLVADNSWLYAGCNDGNVYDLSGKIARVAYQLAQDIIIYWLDIRDGALAVSDAGGNVGRWNYEDESEWSKRTPYSRGWMIRCGEEGIFHGHSHGVTMYNSQDGQQIWERKTSGAVLFGWQQENMLYAGTSDNKVYSFSKTGEQAQIYTCDAGVFSCATAEQGRYVFAGDARDALYCFDQAGQRLWKLKTGCGAAYSMQFFADHLYIVTTEGALACIDVSEAAMKQALAGTLPQARHLQAPAIVETPLPTELETTSDASQGVVLECVQEGGRLRMHAISDGFDRALYVQFPHNIREEGMRYVVDVVRHANYGNFYRAFGNIKKLVQ